MEPILLLLLVITLLHAISAENMRSVSCSSSCGSISNIKYPFRLTTDPSNCGDFRYTLSCENNITVLNLPLHQRHKIYDGRSHVNYQRYYVREINYNNYTIRVVDPIFEKHQNVSSLITISNLSNENFYEYDSYRPKLAKMVVLLSCERVVINPSYIDAHPCVPNNNNWSYYLLEQVSLSELEESCWIKQVTFIDESYHYASSLSCHGINKKLAHGFQLSWIQIFDKSKDHRQICSLNEKSNKVRCRYRYGCVTKDSFQPKNQRFCEVSFEIIFRQVMFYTKCKG
ncbi:uncharacterized protein LOC133786113 [Humulus lupulus]|uniref:uncharacterized protein LOC133786113 n=1 Tax=Humulus lupulus TaxID=3486 RepID=UPI002B414385|nr:uncharacterized protein LOC133786113 [Humulus lupulus]